MKNIAFDSGPIISLATNNLLWILEELKKSFKGEFYISENVRKEIVAKPLLTKKFKFEALQVEALIEKGILVEKGCSFELSQSLLNTANSVFIVENRPFEIVQRAEMETLAIAIENSSDAAVIDERITRTLVENPKGLANTLSKRLHKKITLNKKQAYQVREFCENITIIRSAELATMAYEKGILNKFLAKIPNAKKTLLESILWGVKLNGCALSEEEINRIVRLERV